MPRRILRFELSEMDEYDGWTPQTPPSTAELAERYRAADSGQLVLRNLSNAIGGSISAWIFYLLVATVINPSATSGPEAFSLTELVIVGAVLVCGSVGSYWILVVPRITTYDNGTALIVNPIRTYRVDLRQVQSLSSSRLSFPRLKVGNVSIALVALEQPLLESITDTSENTALLAGEIENAKRHEAPSEVVAMSVGLTNPRLGGWLFLVAWTAYAVDSVVAISGL